MTQLDGAGDDDGDAFGELGQALGKLQIAASTLESALDGVLRYDSRVTGLAEKVVALHDGFRDDHADLMGRLDDIGTELPDRLREKWEELRERIVELHEGLVEHAEEFWKDAVHEATEGWKDKLEKVVEEQVSRFEDVADTVRTEVQEALDELKDRAEQELTERLKEEAQKTKDAALDRLEQEVMDGILTSQMQVQITSALSPILPQLMVVRVVASSIKKALEILRMGF